MEAAARAIIIPLFWHFLHCLTYWLNYVDCVQLFFFGFYSGNLQEKENLSFIASSLYIILLVVVVVAHVLVVIIPCGHPQTHRPRYHLSRHVSASSIHLGLCNCQRENKIIKSFITHFGWWMDWLACTTSSSVDNKTVWVKIKNKKNSKREEDMTYPNVTLHYERSFLFFFPLLEEPNNDFWGEAEGGGSSADKLVNARRFPFSSALAPRWRLLQIETDWTI